MADPAQQVAIPAPVAELVAAWNARSAERFVAVLAPDARVAVPPLHLELEGRDDVWLAVSRLFAAFGAVRYTSRHRYLTPDAVTDEVLLEGLQTQEFLGAPPTGQPGSIAARVIIRHDGQVITELALWPDVAGLRELSDGVARRIDLRSAGPAAPVVAALRATIPVPEARLSVGQGRQLPLTAAAPEGASALLPGAPPSPGGGVGLGANGSGASRGQGQEKGRKKSGPKGPLPRRARRRRAFLAGVVMLALAGGLGTYVVQGVKNKNVPLAAPKPTQTAAAVAATRGVSSAPAPKPSPSPAAATSPPSTKPSFDPKKNVYTFTNTVLFENDKATLRADARSQLLDVIRALEGEKRYGLITVTGYTDITGTPSYNKALSLRRAKTVAAYLENYLAGPFAVHAVGLGAQDFVATNATDAGRQKNRRVEIQVPKPQV